MSRHIDQERNSAFAACPDTDCDWGSFWRGWQARSAVQPAGVAVPDGWKLVPVSPTHEMDLAGIGTHLIGKAQEEGPCHWQWSYYGEIYRAMLAAAPHPVSGERAERPDALRKRFSDIEDEIMAGKHNAASVFTAMRTAALYIGQPAAKDVSGLVEALEQAKEWLQGWGSAAPQLAVIETAIAAHRAQQGEQS